MIQENELMMEALNERLKNGLDFLYCKKTESQHVYTPFFTPDLFNEGNMYLICTNCDHLIEYEEWVKRGKTVGEWVKTDLENHEKRYKARKFLEKVEKEQNY